MKSKKILKVFLVALFSLMIGESFNFLKLENISLSKRSYCLFEDNAGFELEKIRDSYFISYKDEDYKIPNFMFYRFKELDGFENYEYIADCVDIDITKNISFCYFSYDMKDECINCCFSIDNLNIYNLKINDSVNYKEKVLFDYNPIVIEDDPIISMHLSSMIDSLNNILGRNDNTLKAINITTNNNINYNNYSNFTTYDFNLHMYKDFLYGHIINSNEEIINDPIVGLIPKDLFFINGKTIAIGKEFGFFIDTYPDPYNNLYKNSDVLVFDFECTLPQSLDDNSDSDEFLIESMGEFKIEPLFEYKYRGYDKNVFDCWQDNNFAPYLDRVVIPHPTQATSLNNLYILNPKIRTMLVDTTVNNIITEGHYFTYIDYFFNATGCSASRQYYDFSILKFGLGFIPYVGNIINIADFIEDTYNGIQNQNFLQFGETSNCNTEKTNTSLNFIPTYEDHLRKYNGHLIKDISSSFRFEGDNPLLVGINNYFKINYNLARTSNALTNEMNVIHSLSVDIAKDETSTFWFFGWHPSGNLNIYKGGVGTYEYTHINQDD